MEHLGISYLLKKHTHHISKKIARDEFIIQTIFSETGIKLSEKQFTYIPKNNSLKFNISPTVKSTILLKSKKIKDSLSKLSVVVDCFI